MKQRIYLVLVILMVALALAFFIRALLQGGDNDRLSDSKSEPSLEIKSVSRKAGPTDFKTKTAETRTPVEAKAETPAVLAPLPTTKPAKLMKIFVKHQHQKPFGDGFVFVRTKGSPKEYRLHADGSFSLPRTEKPCDLVINKFASFPIFIDQIQLKDGHIIELKTTRLFHGIVTYEGHAPGQEVALTFGARRPPELQQVFETWSFTRRQSDTLSIARTHSDAEGKVELFADADWIRKGWLSASAGFFIPRTGVRRRRTFGVEARIPFRAELQRGQVIVGRFVFGDSLQPIPHAPVSLSWTRRRKSGKQALSNRTKTTSDGRFVLSAPTGELDAIQVTIWLTHRFGSFRKDIPIDSLSKWKTDVGDIVVPSAVNGEFLVLDPLRNGIPGAVASVDGSAQYGPSQSDGILPYKMLPVGDCRIEITAPGFSAVRVARLGESESIPYEITLRPTATIIISGIEAGESITLSCSKGALFANTDGGVSRLQQTLGADRPSLAMTSLKIPASATRATEGTSSSRELVVPAK